MSESSKPIPLRPEELAEYCKDALRHVELNRQWMTERRRTPMNIGDIVRYAKPTNSDEASCRFELVEHNGDRCTIQLICDMGIPPTELVMASEIELA
jgi:hypothetical protein